MKRYEYTIHAKQKLKSSTAKELNITKKKIQNRTKNGGIIRVITFLENKVLASFAYPAEKGRYERKVL